MAVPKKKQSKSRSKRRSTTYLNRRTQDLVGRAKVITCPECQSPMLSHTVCEVCGMYRGKAVLKKAPAPETTRIQV